MASISATGSHGHHTFTLDVSEISTSVANNTSVVHAKLWLAASNYHWSQSSNIVWQTNINGNQASGEITDYSGGDLTLLEVEYTVAHDDNGSKTIGISFSITDNHSAYYTPGSCSASGSMTLTTLPRTSQVSCNPSDITVNGSNAITIYTNRKASSFTHTIKITFGSYSTTITGVATSTKWTPAKSILAQIPSSTSKTGTITCTTYSGSTAIGSSSVNFTLRTSQSVSGPSLDTMTVTETNSTVSAKTTGTVRYLSSKSIKVTYTLKDSATLSSLIVYCGSKQAGFTISGSSGTATISAPTSGTYKVTLIDSRGYQVSKTVTQDFYEYSYPSFDSGASFVRTSPTESNGTLAVSGTYGNVLDNTVTCTLSRTGLDDATPDVSPSSGTWSLSQAYSDLVYTASFSATVKITDSFGQSASLTLTLGRSVPTIWLGKEIVRINGKRLDVMAEGSDNTITDALNINYGDADGAVNMPSVIATEDASTLKNSPVTSGAFYAYREVFPIVNVSGGSGKYKVFVVLHEAYPVAGRVWTRAFNPDDSSWGGGWNVIAGNQTSYNVASGIIAENDAGTATGAGVVNCFIIGKIAFCNFGMKVATNTATTNETTFNIRPSLLKSINSDFPSIKPITSKNNIGTCTYYKSDGTVNTSLTGYGGIIYNKGGTNFGFSRVYKTDGSTGAWGVVSLPVDTIIRGQFYATL